MTRKVFICKYCEGVYADDPVSQCDCLGATGKPGPHFMESSFSYSDTEEVNQDLTVRVARLLRRIEKKDRRIEGLERKVEMLSREITARTLDLGNLSSNMESAVTRALCNVRMIPVFGGRRDRVIIETRTVAPTENPS